MRQGQRLRVAQWSDVYVHAFSSCEEHQWHEAQTAGLASDQVLNPRCLKQLHALAQAEQRAADILYVCCRLSDSSPRYISTQNSKAASAPLCLLVANIAQSVVSVRFRGLNVVCTRPLTLIDILPTLLSHCVLIWESNCAASNVCTNQERLL